MNRPDIVENETEKFLISIPKAESSEPDEAACENYVKVKRVKRRLKKKKDSPAWSEVFLTRPWDGLFDSKQIEGKFVETDEDGDVKKVSNVIAFKLPSMNIEQRMIASAVRGVRARSARISVS